jgi:hypothetical protein
VIGGRLLLIILWLLVVVVAHLLARSADQAAVVALVVIVQRPLKHCFRELLIQSPLELGEHQRVMQVPRQEIVALLLSLPQQHLQVAVAVAGVAALMDQVVTVVQVAAQVPPLQAEAQATLL